MPTVPPPTTSTLRRALLVLVGVGLLGTVGELLLIPHTEELWQLSPVLSAGVAVAAIVWHLVAPGRWSARGLGATLVLLAACGFAGLWLHYDANVEFEREISTDAGGFRLFWRAIHGTAPPSLAPGALVELALLGALALWRDPAASLDPPRRSP